VGIRVEAARDWAASTLSVFINVTGSFVVVVILTPAAARPLRPPPETRRGRRLRRGIYCLLDVRVRAALRLGDRRLRRTVMTAV
jgi:uncharacterized membrane protein